MWGVDNRTCGFRLVGHGEGRRVECRIPGADVNPYLALAAVMAAGLWGVEHGLELPPPFEGNAYNATDVPRVPTTLVEAIDELASSAIATHAFGDDVHSPPSEHRPTGVGAVEPDGHRLGARPELRAHLIVGPVPARLGFNAG